MFSYVLFPLVYNSNRVLGILSPLYQKQHHFPWPPYLLRKHTKTLLSRLSGGKGTPQRGWHPRCRAASTPILRMVSLHVSVSELPRVNIYWQGSRIMEQESTFNPNDEQLKNIFLTALKDWGHYNFHKKTRSQTYTGLYIMGQSKNI